MVNIYANPHIHTNSFTSGGFLDGSGADAWTPEALDEATVSLERTSRADRSSTFDWKAETRGSNEWNDFFLATDRSGVCGSLIKIEYLYRRSWGADNRRLDRRCYWGGIEVPRQNIQSVVSGHLGLQEEFEERINQVLKCSHTHTYLNIVIHCIC